MARPRPLCPRCHRPVGKGGIDNGQQRWQHGARIRPPCSWHGFEPIWPKQKAPETGIDKASVDILHREIRGDKWDRLVITAAQNATPVNKPFLASLLRYCKHHGAQLVVIPYRYKNPTSHWSGRAEHDDWWAAELAPYLLDRRIDLNKHLVLLADIKTQPTASDPLRGFETMTGGKSAIVGHPKLELETVPTPQAKLPKLLTTTGSLTVKNYTPTKAGKKGEHHHTFGACLVELTDRRFHLRQINAATDGSFCDLDGEYRPDGISHGHRVEAMVMGDSHVEFIDPGVVKATFEGDRSIVAALRPKLLIWHDVHDFYSRNHHHRGEVFINLVKHRTGRDDVERWLDDTFAFIDRVTPEDAQNIFVASNHPDALARWIKETDPRFDPQNCIFWARTFAAMCEGSRWTESGAATIDPFAYWGLRKLKTAKQSRFLSRGESFVVKGIELGYHGDKGSGGAPGSLRTFGKIGVRTITGHEHGPGIKDGAYKVGTNSRLRLGYNDAGPSNWLHTDAIVYKNGKRSLLNIIDGEWRA